MRMAQNQMGMGGNLMDGGQMAPAPHMMSTHYAPSEMQMLGNMPASGGWQSANSIMSVPPDQTASMSFGTGIPGTVVPEMHQSGEEWSFEDATPSAVPQNAAPKTAVGPTPDPAFSETESSSNVTNVSLSASSKKTAIAGSSSNEPPLVEAF